MSDRVERKRLLMMKILRESGAPLSSQKIQEQLTARGMDISERTVRFHLQALDSKGLTGYKEKKGRFLTPKGLMELAKAHVYDRVGFLSAKIDEMTYKMSFDPVLGEGSVLVNMSLVGKDQRDAVAALVPPVFSSGLANGQLMALLDEGEQVGDQVIPAGKMGIGTVCSITMNGALIKAGIPVTSVFGGLLEIHDRAPDRFTAIIRYDGTSLDPLEVYITSGMTRTGEAAREGNGLIGASFREIPASARELALETDAKLSSRGLGGFLKLGYPSQTLLDIPVGDGRTGMVVAGGLNAIAPLVEEGIPLESKALSGLVEYQKLFPSDELSLRLSRLK
ncbi:MAG: NrpR regulatory domain-containing protein [Spirochaetales bacterium]|nr:NrpR regulatory domain-containing protein [Spirochaetales bacterium]